MAKISYITPNFAVAPQLGPEDFKELEAKGFRAIISNRPDSENGVALPARQAATMAWRHGLRFRHVPTSMDEVLDDTVVENFAEALAAVDGPVLAYCKSGTRAAILWALVAVRQQPVDCVLEALLGSGYDLAFLRDDLLAQASRGRNGVPLAALDCGGREQVAA
ncbi:MAG: TIGR01244 family phosphatase [Hyphomicrobiaceae bacterium]|nr:MAG: TIGR01244 family phosphatase [Hyphomicrobiaceae bacterium]